MHRCATARVLQSAVLCSILWCLSVSWLGSGARVRLVCNYSRLMDRKGTPMNITTGCRRNHLCYSAWARDTQGVHVLSAQGCVAAHRCGSSKIVQYKGRAYNLSYTCCCGERCNPWPSPEVAPLAKLLEFKRKGFTGTWLDDLIKEVKNGTMRAPIPCQQDATRPNATVPQDATTPTTSVPQDATIPNTTVAVPDALTVKKEDT